MSGNHKDAPVLRRFKSRLFAFSTAANCPRKYLRRFTSRKTVAAHPASSSLAPGRTQSRPGQALQCCTRFGERAAQTSCPKRSNSPMLPIALDSVADFCL
jgi:hypothetical protein